MTGTKDIFYALLVAMLFPLTGYSQCNNCTGQWPAGAQSTTSNTLIPAAGGCNYAGEYSVFNVTVGETYTWSTCGVATFDTQLTLYANGGGCVGASIADNDDACGLQSTITWTATFTGQVSLLVSQFFCTSSTFVCSGIEWACTSCGGGGPADITACSGNWYDPGGAFGNYPANANEVTTICPDVVGECVQINFSSFDLEAGWDFLTVYDGPSTASPLIGVFSGFDLNGATLQSSDPSGCLTFLFESDGSFQYTGWAASIACSDCDDPPPAPPEDCNGGITICSDATFNGNSSGPGVPELNASNQGCLAFENESTWYFFSPQSTGTIAFMLEPTPAVDYDFAIWGPYPSPSCPPSEAPLRCSWSAAAVNTGLQAGAGDNSEGAGGDAVVNPITVGPAEVGQVYILLIDNWTASTTPFTFDWNLGGGLTLDCTPLPVELLDFTGIREGEQNVLRWKTATEINADYYEVERSADGQNFERIGQLSAAGNSNAEQSYVFKDPKIQQSTQYYRLKQVDFNGEFERFGPVAISAKPGGAIVEAPFPNPLSDGILNFRLHLQESEIITSKIYDITGRLLIQNTDELGKGQQLLQLDLSNLVPGNYHIQLSDASGSVIQSSRVVR